MPSEFAQSLEQEGILELYRSVDFQSFEEYRTRGKGSGSKTYRRSYTFSDGEGTGGLSDETGSYVDNGEYSNDSRPQNILDNEEPNFALRAPVEETKDLIAVHNAKEKNVRGLLGLGGLPMPSIAIIKAAQGHDNFGEYSFVFDKSTIDPATNRNNKVYGSDAFTPVAPHIEYEVKDNKAYKEFQSEISSLNKDMPATNHTLSNIHNYNYFNTLLVLTWDENGV